MEAGLTRVCVVASTSAVGCAVRRNRAKRRMRELFRRHQEDVASGCDLMLVARSGLLRLPQAELENRFMQAIQRMRPKPAEAPERHRGEGDGT